MKFVARKLYVLVLVLFGTVTSLSAAPSLVLEGNLLAGAKNVNVAGNLYDVSFKDGSCLSLFGGCSNSAITFDTYAQAHAASNALYLDVFKGVYKTTPELTSGCTGGGIACMVLTPYNANNGVVYYSYLMNGSTPLNLLFEPNSLYNVANYYDTTTRIDKTFAVWSVAAVPEPQTYAMLLAGLSLMGFVALRRRGGVTLTK